MKKTSVVVSANSGIHARPASLLVKVVAEFDAEINIIKGEKEFNARSIMGVLSMGAKKGDELTFVAQGPDEENVITKIEELFISGFGE